MARFDFVDSSSRGYAFVWRERRALIQLAAWPFLLKIASFTAVAFLGMGDNLLRQGLLLLPSYFAEGWLIAQIIRLAVLHEPQTALLSAGGLIRERKNPGPHSRALLSGAIVYVLTKMFMAVFFGMFMLQQGLAPSVETPPPALPSLFAGVIALALMIWAFRFLWLYVPASLEYRLEDFLIRIKPFISSLYMMGVWILCFAPVAFLFIGLSQVVGVLFAGSGGYVSGIHSYAMILLQAASEMLLAVLSSVAMAYGVHSIYNGPRKTGLY
ncbi:MAG: hypothetical protein K9G62_05750 [Alphaproteobacteria bacterium]|nr:hypothetical protein [Alphaproteobacteria bacterium]